MKEEIIINYQNVISTLEDIHALGKSDLLPLIGQAYYHFAEIHRMAILNDSLHNLSNLRNFLETSVNLMIRDSLLFTENIVQVNYFNDSSSFNLEKWDKILELLPIFLQVVKIFDLHGVINFVLGHNGLQVEGAIHSLAEIKKLRADIYRLFRYLLRKKVLLTYKVEQESQSTPIKIKLNLDLADQETNLYCVDMIKEHGLFLGLSNIFAKYAITVDQALKLGKHFCLEIDQALKLRKYNHFPSFLVNEAKTFEIMYFPFLFRPLSIIIPSRGKLIPVERTKRLGDTGSGKAVLVQIHKSEYTGDSNDSELYPLWYFDLFSLINQ